MNYQAVIRDTSSYLVSNQEIGIRISILQGSDTGTIAYTETQNHIFTNENGLLNIEFGGGAGFAAIPWSEGPFFIKTETDPTGGTNYTISGVSQLLSVPYAQYAANARTIHYIGENYGGGIVFYVYDEGQHGLIAATVDQSAGIQWYNGTYRFTGATANGIGAGAMNTALIIAGQMPDNQTGDFAARACVNYCVTVGGVTYGDWYLPSSYELDLLYRQKTIVGGFTSGYYWSSNECSSDVNFATNLYFYSGYTMNCYYRKTHLYLVRAIRKF